MSPQLAVDAHVAHLQDDHLYYFHRRPLKRQMTPSRGFCTIRILQARRNKDYSTRSCQGDSQQATRRDRCWTQVRSRGQPYVG